MLSNTHCHPGLLAVLSVSRILVNTSHTFVIKCISYSEYAGFHDSLSIRRCNSTGWSRLLSVRSETLSRRKGLVAADVSMTPIASTKLFVQCRLFTCMPRDWRITCVKTQAYSGDQSPNSCASFGGPGGASAKASATIGEALRVLPPDGLVTVVTVTPSSSFTTKIHLPSPPKCSPGSLRGH